ncbi:MAG: hypothetical protein Q8L48_27480 [Archangium sp.]|nr:hypothetical protein [Archangium sp.]
MEELLPRVVKVMGLPGPKNVKVKLVSREQAEALLRQDLEEDRDHLQRLGEALLAVGLLPAGTKLEALAPDFNRQNVNGFYDLRQHTLFLLDDQPDEAQRPIVAHELAHAVQDANVDLDAAMTARRGSEDATLAFTAVLEGQAQATAALVMEGWLRDQHVTVEGMAGLLSDTAAKSAAEAAERAPTPWLGLQLRFPYVAGRELIAANATADDPIARGLLSNPPASTAQVLGPLTPALSPLRRERETQPLEGRLQLDRLIPNAKPSISTTLGRANLELLGAGLGEGWRGDRLESVRAGKKTITAWVIVFESPEQSAKVAAALKNASASGRAVVLLVGEPSPKVRAALLAREFR